MTERGLPIVDGAPACPFVAFDDDRDERAGSPDHRHRCFAESPPAPRALAHQEAYCLSSAFPVCPTFQDWARREAAHARSGATGSPEAADDGDDDLPPLVAERPPRRSGQQTWSAPPPWLRGGGTGRDAGVPPTAGPSDATAGRPPAGPGRDDDADGLAAAAGAAGLAAGGLAGSYADRMTAQEPTPRVVARPAPLPPPPAPIPAPRAAWDDDAVGDEAADAAPARSAGRYDAQQAAAMEDLPPRRRGHERVEAGRDDLQEDAYGPSWERPRRLEAYPTLRSRRMPGAVLPALVLGFAVVVLAGGAFFFLPMLLGSGTGSRATSSPSPSLALSSAPAASVLPTVAPAATPFVYLVQPGDSMFGIATKFGVPLADLIAANHDTVPNPNLLQAGVPLVIPAPAPSELPAAS